MSYSYDPQDDTQNEGLNFTYNTSSYNNQQDYETGDYMEDHMNGGGAMHHHHHHGHYGDEDMSGELDAQEYAWDVIRSFF